MLTLDSPILIPDHITFTILPDGAVLLNTRTNRYYSLEETGARLWELLGQGRELRDAYDALLLEFDVEPDALERDLLGLIAQLESNGLVELAESSG